MRTTSTDTLHTHLQLRSTWQLWKKLNKKKKRMLLPPSRDLTGPPSVAVLDLERGLAARLLSRVQTKAQSLCQVKNQNRGSPKPNWYKAKKKRLTWQKPLEWDRQGECQLSQVKKISLLQKQVFTKNQNLLTLKMRIPTKTILQIRAKEWIFSTTVTTTRSFWKLQKNKRSDLSKTHHSRVSKLGAFYVWLWRLMTTWDRKPSQCNW